MKTETKSFAEYKAPGCKVVPVQLAELICNSLDDYNSTVNTDGDNDLGDI